MSVVCPSINAIDATDLQSIVRTATLGSSRRANCDFFADRSRIDLETLAIADIQVRL